MPLLDKIKTIANEIYRAGEAIAAPKAIRDQLRELEKQGYGNLPICMAKTQYTFSTDPDLLRRADRPRACRSARCGCRPAPGSSWRSAATS